METKVHKILGKDLTVELKKPTELQKTSVSTNLSILVNNVPDTISDDLLVLYIDNLTGLDGESGDYIINRCDGLQVTITFNASVDLPTGGIKHTIIHVSSLGTLAILVTLAVWISDMVAYRKEN